MHLNANIVNYVSRPRPFGEELIEVGGLAQLAAGFHPLGHQPRLFALLAALGCKAQLPNRCGAAAREAFASGLLERDGTQLGFQHLTKPWCDREYPPKSSHLL